LQVTCTRNVKIYIDRLHPGSDWPNWLTNTDPNLLLGFGK